MRVSVTAALILTTLSLSACASDGHGGRIGHRYHDGEFGDRDRSHHDYRGRVLGHDRHWRYLGERDRIYRSKNGHYFCKRRDGSDGSLVGALTGDALENTISRGKSKRLETILREDGGALAGRAIGRGAIRCE